MSDQPAPPPGHEGRPPQPPPPGSPLAPQSAPAPPPTTAAGPGASGPGNVPPPIALGRPLHKPGTVPLRPLTLGDLFDGAFTTIRRNPRATIGMGAVVTTCFMVLPALGTVLLAASGGVVGLGTAGTDGARSTLADAGIVVASALGGLFSFLASIVVAGLIVPVVTRATLGERLTAGDAWRQARGCLLRLVVLAFLELVLLAFLLAVPTALAVLVGVAVSGTVLAVVLGILVGLASALGCLAVHVRWFQLAAPSLVVEKRSVGSALGRSGRLVKGQFWRILGIFVLVAIATGFVSQVIAFPFSILGAGLGVAFPGSSGTVALLLSSNLATVVAGAVVGPFSGAVAVLQYLDQRFRKEGFDIELINHVQARRSR